MKVVLFNGSPNAKGNTATTLSIMEEYLKDSSVETEVVHVGKHVIRGCMACQKCFKTRDEKCVFDDDPVNEWIQKIKNADGVVFASPVHYSGVAGTMKSFLDRAFYVSGANGNLYRNKVGVSVSAVRRSGGIPCVNQLNKYLEYSEMLMPSSNYWNVIHGTRPGEVLQDKEGVQIIENLAERMHWALSLVSEGKDRVAFPKPKKKVVTNFIR